jgi:CheY-like chemotaxis protein
MEKANESPIFGWTVLSVENDPANALLVETFLARRSNLRLLTAGTGNEGCEMARSFQPDMILMDIRLPDTSGFEACWKILQHPIYRS